MRASPTLLLIPLLALALPGAGCQPDDTADDDVADDDTASGDDDTTPWDPRFDPLAEAIEQERKSLGAPGVAVAVFEGGEVTFAAGFGSRHPDREEPVEATTLFRIGSVTKMLTATAVLQLVDEGLVDLDAPVPDYVPGFDFALDPSWAPAMTVRHTLTHQAGIFDYLEIDSDRDDDALSEAMTGWFVDNLWVMSPPGRMWNYSNPNYYTAGLIAETVRGEWYRDVMREHVFAPLGMDRTFFLPDEVLADGDYATALTYDWTFQSDEQRIAEPDSYDNAWGRPAGYAWSSVLDLARFGIFLIHGDPAVLSDALREEMQSPVVSTEILLDYDHYGYGLVHDVGFFLDGEWYDTPFVLHDGAIPGFSAGLYLLPELDFGVAILSNADGAYYSSTLATAFGTLVQLPPPGQAPDFSVDPATFGAYVGTYLDPWNVGEIMISQEGDGLRIDCPLLDDYSYPYEHELVPYTPGNFLWGIGGTETLLTFIVDDEGQGEYTRARFSVGERVDEGEAPGARAAVPFDRERLDRAVRRAALPDGPRVGWPPFPERRAP